ncbi:MAG: hypothetical protein IIC59_11510, partial [Proteobacteria bacterium]|nr:hypothetical protein [Pseudomonadota bacterium]
DLPSRSLQATQDESVIHIFAVFDTAYFRIRESGQQRVVNEADFSKLWLRRCGARHEDSGDR